VCGEVVFEVKDADIMMNALCHCRACARGRGMSPVHLLVVPAASYSIVQVRIAPFLMPNCIMH
jgi:hypothetical protein